MSNTSQQQKSSTRTKYITDSYNTTNTVNKVIDNVGNNAVYLNTMPENKSGNTNSLIIAAAALAGLYLVNR